MTAKEPIGFFVPTNAVGRVGINRYVTPTGQILTPSGRQIELPGFRPQALALSPDGKLLVTAGRTNVIAVIDAASGKILQRVSLSTNKVEAEAAAKVQDDPSIPSSDSGSSSSSASETNGVTSGTNSATSGTNSAARGTRSRTNAPPASSALLSFTGLTFSPDGRLIFLANASSSNLRVFPVDKNDHVGTPFQISVPDSNAPKEKKEIPTGLAVSSDSKRVYVAGNLGNRLHEIDVESRKTLRTWRVGVAPFDVVLARDKAYVSNVGGRRPATNDLTAPAGKGTLVRVDPIRNIPNEGSVTVIDLKSDKIVTNIIVEMHASAMAVSPNENYVVVANTGSDTLSVIDTKTDEVVEKIWARQTPADLFGAQPNALAFDKSGKRLFVCNGTQNAVAVVQFEPEDRSSRVIGLIPVGWFPGAIVCDVSRKRLCVANIKGIGALRMFKPDEKIKLGTKDYYGVVSLIPIPGEKELAVMTELALQNIRYPKLAEALQPPRADQPPRPVPERVGEPSVFKHVIYIIKENRSYDQVLGDMKEGNGNTNLCTFGERYTPNQHKMAREFILLDNTYCSGVQSADGHQWTDSAIANEYVERQLTANYPRSYPGAKQEDSIDALAWASSGFIWDNVLAHGKTIRNYGEWMISEANWADPKARAAASSSGRGGRSRGGQKKPGFRDFYNDYIGQSNLTELVSRPGIETLRKVSNTNTVGWDLNVLDVMRAAVFIKELKQFEETGDFPQLILMLLPNDHTGGTRDKGPTPGAQVADNDLAFGRIVEAVSHSKFWPETCIVAIEDDPQMGWDHVSGYRTTCYIVSPYTKRKQTISTHYNQTCVVRTIELMLGLPPMNHFDATATPMTDCFMAAADLTPFNSVTNNYPLDRINADPKKITNRILRQDAIVSSRLPLDEPDKCPEDVLNRILWHAMKGPDVPYPEWAVKNIDLD